MDSKWISRVFDITLSGFNDSKYYECLLSHCPESLDDVMTENMCEYAVAWIATHQRDFF